MCSLTEVITTLHGVIQSTERLKALVGTSCDVNFDDLTAHGLLGGQIGEVVREMNARGSLDRLLAKVLEEYGTNDGCRAVIEPTLEKLRNGPLPSGAPVALPPAADATADLIIRRLNDGRIEWLAPFPPEYAAQLWGQNPPAGRVIAELEWDEDCPFNQILLRLLCHCAPGRVKMEVQGNTLWMNVLHRCLEAHLPTECRQLAVSGWNEVAEGGVAGTGGVLVTLPAMVLADAVRSSLDAWCLGELDRNVRSVLQPGSGYTGRFSGIEPGLAGEMRRRWKGWHDSMTASNDTVRARFLDMLVSWPDDGSRPQAGVGLGPESVSRCMLPATLLALAVACCLEPDPLKPAAGTPGNVATSVIRGHASGVELVGSVPLEHVFEQIKDLPWTSRLVMLGNCKDSPSLLRLRNESLFSSPDSPEESRTASWGRNTLPPPAIVTFERAMLQALKGGKTVLTAHLTSLVTELANIQRDRLDLRAPSPPAIETATIETAEVEPLAVLGV